MLFTNKASTLLLMLFIALSVGCTNRPEQKQSNDDQIGLITPASKTPRTLTPNPYLKNNAAAPSAAREPFQRALDAMKNKAWDSAEIILLKLIKDYPELSGPYFNLALVLENKGDTGTAVKRLHDAIERNSKNVYAYNELARLQRTKGMFDEAEQSYLEALTIWPDYPDANLNLAILYDLYLGKKELALQYYQNSAELDTHNERQLKGWIIDLNRQLAEAKQ